MRIVGLRVALACLSLLSWSASLGRAQQASPADAVAQEAAPAQPAEPAAAQPAPVAAGAQPESRESRVTRLAREIERMQADLQAQRAELQAQRAELDAQAQAQQEAELAGLMSDAQSEAAALEVQSEPLLRVYGFADVGLQRTWGSVADVVPGGTQKTTFVLGNVNFYFDSNPLPDWRFLTELRLGLFPHGAVPRGGTGSLATIDNTISDDGSSNGGFTNIVWNGVLLERSHIDWTPRDEFKLRAGWFLTPYGIWNVDHGSPTRLMIEPPFFISLQLMPERQLGVEVFGQFQALPWTLGYHLYVSNGRQPGQLDFEDEKALGGRLWARTRHPFPMTLGVSGYTGHFEQLDKAVGLRPDGMLSVTTSESLAFRDYAWGADVSMDIGALRIRSEGVFRLQIYEDGKRDSLIPGTTLADRFTLGAYSMVAYQLPWYGLEPVFLLEIVRLALPLGELAGRIGGGLNIYLSSVTILRTSYVYSELFDVQGPERSLPYNQFHSVASRLIIAF